MKPLDDFFIFVGGDGVKEDSFVTNDIAIFRFSLNIYFKLSSLKRMLDVERLYINRNTFKNCSK